MDPALLEHAVNERITEWASRGITARFHPASAEERSRNKWASYVELESPDAFGQLTVWTSGEAELLVGYTSDGMHRTDHYDLMDDSGLAACLDDLISLMLTRPPNDTLHTLPGHD